MNEFLLFIDETGTPVPNGSGQDIFVLTGIVIQKKNQEKLSTDFDELKKKFFKRKNIVFHSRQIIGESGDFEIFRGKPNKKRYFIDGLLNSIERARIISFYAVVDKNNISPTWKLETVIRKTARSIFYNFMCYLFTRPQGSKGKIIIEGSSADKDIEYLKAFTRLLGPGDPMIDSTLGNHMDRKQKLTQISYVTKLNYDTETQIADILSYGAVCLYKLKSGIASYDPESYEGRLINILKKKLFTLPKNAKKNKKKYFKLIKSFEVLSYSKKRP